MNELASIPTTYNGINFRSRLEARWAAFFDLLGWSWEYEAFDLPGWIPDFKIKGKKDIYVEVKPFKVFDQYPKINPDWHPQLIKINIAQPKLDVLLLSDSPFENNGNSEECFGFILSSHEDPIPYDVTLYTDLLEKYYFLERIPFANHTPMFCRKEQVMTNLQQPEKDKISSFWKIAGNQTQWKKNK